MNNFALQPHAAGSITVSLTTSDSGAQAITAAASYHFVTIWADAAFRVKIGDSSVTCGTSEQVVPANAVVIFALVGGTHLSARTLSGTGSLYACCCNVRSIGL